MRPPPAACETKHPIILSIIFPPVAIMSNTSFLAERRVGALQSMNHLGHIFKEGVMSFDERPKRPLTDRKNKYGRFVPPMGKACTANSYFRHDFSIVSRQLWFEFTASYYTQDEILTLHIHSLHPR
jgi:hypothetical protein